MKTEAGPEVIQQLGDKSRKPVGDRTHDGGAEKRKRKSGLEVVHKWCRRLAEGWGAMSQLAPFLHQKDKGSERK